MHVLEVNTVYQFGSTGKIVKDLKETLESKGNIVTVACGRDYGDVQENVYVLGSRTQAYIDATTARVFDNAGFGIIGPTKKLISIIERHNPDIIHLHNIHGYYLNINLLFEYFKGKNHKIVWTFHDCWPFTGHCTYFDYVCCTKWKKGCEKCIQKKKYPSSYVFDRSHENYNKKKALFNGLTDLTIVTPSDWLNSLVKQSYLKQYDVLTINNGIDLSVFKPTNSNLRKRYELEDKTVILAVASIWGGRKGYSAYFQLAKMLPDRFRIVMIGLNQKQLSELPPNIIGITRTSSQNELAAWYSAADVFLLLTEEDNFPTVNIESLACGLPIIAYNVGGATEAFDKNTGIAIERGKLEDVATVLKEAKYLKLSREACIERAKRFDKNICYAKYEDLFNQSIGKR